MAFYDKFPYTNFQELNLDKIVQNMGEVKRDREAAEEAATNASEDAQSASASAAAAESAKETAVSSAATIAGAANQIYENTERLNTLIVEGTPTEGNAELIDIRTGADHVSYDTAGDAVRGQYTGNLEAISSMRKWAGYNYFNAENLVQGYSINASGEMIPAADPASVCTKLFTPIIPNTHFMISHDGVGLSMQVVAFYDSAYNFISRVTSIGSFTTPANTAYFKACRTTIPGTKIQFEEGNTITAYQPYWTVNEDHYTVPFNIEPRAIDPFMISGEYDDEILRATGTLETVTPYRVFDGYYNYMPPTDSINGPVATQGFSIYYFNITDSLPFYYTGRLQGSARVCQAVFLNENEEPIGWNGVRSSATPVDFVNDLIVPPAGAAKIAFCAITNTGYPLTIRRYQKATASAKTITPAAYYFTGHAETARFNADMSHIICYGQSLSTGADSKYYSDPALPGCYVLGSLAAPAANLQPLRIASGHQHPIVSAVNSLHDLIWNNSDARPDLIAGSYGAGGQSIAQLMSPARQAEIKAARSFTYDIESSGKYQVFLDALDAGKTVAESQGKTINCPIIFFLQGERDYYSDEEIADMAGSQAHAYACGADKALYKQYMTELKNDMQQAVMDAYGQTEKPVFAIYEVQGAFIKNREMTINMAQIEFANENDDVILLQSPYCVPRYSSNHLTTNGYRWYGEYMAEAAFKTIALRSISRPMLICNTSIEGTVLKLTIKNTEYLPLQINNKLVQQASGYGFAVWIDGTRATMRGVKCFGDQIWLTLGQDMSNASSVVLTYGGQDTAGRGNICDSNPYIAKYKFKDESNDSGSSGNLTIPFTPTQSDGSSLVDHKYPMLNWLNNFYAVAK